MQVMFNSREIWKRLCVRWWINGNKSMHMRFSVMCVDTDPCSLILFFVFLSCIMPLICGGTMQLLNKRILKLPWIKFSGAILDNRMFTLFFFSSGKSVPFSHSVQSLILRGWFNLCSNFMVCNVFCCFIWNERRVFIVTHFSLLLSLVDYIRCIHIPVFIYLRERWILKLNFLLTPQLSSIFVWLFNFSCFLKKKKKKK